MPTLLVPTLLVPDSVTWPLPDLPLEVRTFNPREALDPALQGAEALLVWGIPRAQLKSLLETMPNLRWVQTLTAGIDHVLSSSLKSEIQVCKGEGLHDAPTAELAVALLLSAARKLHQFRDRQKGASWDKSAYGAALEGQGFYSLEGARILIAGMGSIGLDIAHKLAAFGAKVQGVAQSAGTRQGFVTHTLEDLERLLPNFDALVLALPNTPDTRHFLSRERIALLGRHAWVVNVGRGTAIDQNALIEALEGGKLGGVALDVFETEPLPADSKLWALENAIITPHVGGGGPRFYGKANDLLLRNAQHFVAGEALEFVVDREKGY